MMGCEVHENECLLFAAATIAAFVPFVQPGQPVVMTALFVAVPTLFAAVFAGAWLMAGDLFEGTAPAMIRKIYSRIGPRAWSVGLSAGHWCGFLRLA